MCIAAGSFHQGSEIFPPESTGKQCVSNSIIVVICHTEKPVNTWNSEDLDMILLNGNDLYLKIHTQHDYLLINEFPDIVNLNKKTFKICYTQTLYGSLSTASTRLEEVIKMFRYWRYMGISSYVETNMDYQQ